MPEIVHFTDIILTVDKCNLKWEEMKTLDLNIVGGEEVQLEQQEALKFRYGWLNDKESK